MYSHGGRAGWPHHHYHRYHHIIIMDDISLPPYQRTPPLLEPFPFLFLFLSLFHFSAFPSCPCISLRPCQAQNGCRSSQFRYKTVRFRLRCRRSPLMWFPDCRGRRTALRSEKLVAIEVEYSRPTTVSTSGQKAMPGWWVVVAMFVLLVLASRATCHG